MSYKELLEFDNDESEVIDLGVASLETQTGPGTSSENGVEELYSPGAH